MLLFVDDCAKVMFVCLVDIKKSVEESAKLRGQLDVLNFVELKNKVWKLDGSNLSLDVFDFIHVQIQIKFKPKPVRREVLEFCLLINKHEEEISVPKPDLSRLRGSLTKQEEDILVPNPDVSRLRGSLFTKKVTHNKMVSTQQVRDIILHNATYDFSNGKLPHLYMGKGNADDHVIRVNSSDKIIASFQSENDCFNALDKYNRLRLYVETKKEKNEDL